MNHNSLHDPQGGNYGSYTPSASMGFRYNWDIYGHTFVMCVEWH